MDKSAFREALVSSFNLSELFNLCIDIGANYESLRGDTIDQKASELVDYCMRRGIEGRLAFRCQELRPTVPWADYLGLDPANTVKSIDNSDSSYHNKSQSLRQQSSTLRLDEDELFFLLFAMRFIEGGINFPEETQRERMELRILSILMNDFGYDASELIEGN